MYALIDTELDFSVHTLPNQKILRKIAKRVVIRILKPTFSFIDQQNEQESGT
jgi:hypothetical protein